MNAETSGRWKRQDDHEVIATWVIESREIADGVEPVVRITVYANTELGAIWF